MILLMDDDEESKVIVICINMYKNDALIYVQGQCIEGESYIYIYHHNVRIIC